MPIADICGGLCGIIMTSETESHEHKALVSIFGGLVEMKVKGTRVNDWKRRYR